MSGRLTVADAAVALHADWEAFQREVATQGTTQAKTAGQKISAALGPNAITKAFTAAGAAGGALFTGAIGGAVNFEDQLRTINTVAHLSDAELKGVGNSILDLSKETGKSTDDLTAGFYDLVSAGVPAKDAINVLRDSAKFATGALGTTAEAVDLVTSAMNAYGLKAGDSTRITDIFAQAVADGKVTAAELGQSIASIAPLAASSGVKLTEVSAAAAVMTAKGSSASEAFTTMRQAISALLTPNETLIELQKRTGKSFADVAREKGLAVALEELRLATNGNNEEFAKALGSTQAYQFALATTGENAGAFATELGKVTTAADEGGVAQGQYTEKMKSAKAQGDKMLASIHALAVEIGGPFTEVLGPAVSVVGQLGQGLHGLFLVSSGLGGLLGRIVGGAWTRLAGSSAVTALIRIAGGKAATAYLAALIAGDGLIAAVKGAWTAVTSSSLVTGAVSRAGTFLGTSLGTFAAVAFAAVLVYKAVETYNDIKDRLGAQGKDIGQHVGEQIATGTIAELEQSKAALTQGIADLDNAWGGQLFGDDTRNTLVANLAAVDGALAERANHDFRDMGQTAGSAFVKTLDVKGPFGSDLAQKVNQTVTLATKGAFGSDLAAKSDYARSYGNRLAGATAEGIRNAQSLVDQAWTTLMDAIKHAQTPTARAATLLGRLASRRLAAALNDDRPEVRLQAEATFQATVDELQKIVDSGGHIGKKGMEALERAMRSRNPQIASAALVVYEAAHKPIAKLPAAGTTAGKATATNVADQLRQGKGPVGTAAASLAKTIFQKLLGGLSAEFASEVDQRHQHSGNSFAVGSPYIPYDQVALIHQGERILTRDENAAISSGQATLGRAGDTVHVDVVHTLDPEAARNFAAAGLDSDAIGKALADAGNASGFLSNLRQLQTMAG